MSAASQTLLLAVFVLVLTWPSERAFGQFVDSPAVGNEASNSLTPDDTPPIDPEETVDREKARSTVDSGSRSVRRGNGGRTTRTSSYAYSRGRRPQARYRYPYAYRYPRNYRMYQPRVYYYGPAYRYPAYVYPRTPSMMYYGPSTRVTCGPWIYVR